MVYMYLFQEKLSFSTDNASLCENDKVNEPKNYPLSIKLKQVL